MRYIEQFCNIIISSSCNIFLFVSAALEKSCNDLKDEGYEVRGDVVDLADKESVYAAADKVKKEV